MIRVPSTGALCVKAKSAGDLRALCAHDTSTLLSATATIVTASASIADSSHSTVALIGAVASIVGATATLMTTAAPRPRPPETPRQDIVQVFHGRSSEHQRTGVLLGGAPALQTRRRLDLRVLARLRDDVSVGDCLWDGPGPAGVFINGTPEAEYMQRYGVEVLEVTVVGAGSFV